MKPPLSRSDFLLLAKSPSRVLCAHAVCVRAALETEARHGGMLLHVHVLASLSRLAHLARVSGSGKK